MLKEIIASCLFTFSCSSGSVSKLEPKKAYSNNYIYGGYCFVDGHSDFGTNLVNINGTLYVDTEHQDIAPFYLGDDVWYWLESINLWRVSSITPDGTTYGALRVTFDYYREGQDFEKVMWINNDDYLEDYSYSGIYFYFSKQYYAPSNDFQFFFNSIFSHQGNADVVCYTGYYTLARSSEITNYLGACGSIIANNNLYYNMRVTGTNPIRYLTFDYANGDNGQHLNYKSFTTPLSTEYSNQFYFQGALMSTSTYQKMQTYGVFAYVTEPSDSDFYDLTISIADTPIRVLTGLFDFSLFGMEFFVAFCGIFTLIMIVVIIKKVV